MEGTSGSSQLRQTFEIMSKTETATTFLFVWDCDFASTFAAIGETKKFRKFCFAENRANTIARDKDDKAIGIENLYADDLFTKEVYSYKEIGRQYRGTTYVKDFDKQKFLEKDPRSSVLVHLSHILDTILGQVLLLKPLFYFYLYGII